MSEPKRAPGTGYLIAVVATATAILIRWFLDPWLGNTLPFTTLFGAIAVAFWYGGRQPALLATVLGYLAVNYLFIHPRGRFNFNGATDLVGLLLYFISCFVIIAFGSRMRSAERRYQAAALEASAKRKDLELAFAEHEQAEQIRSRLALIVESSQDAILSKDMEGLITSWNRGAEKVYGYAAHEAIGRHISILAPPGREDELTAFMERLRHGEAVEQYETKRQRKDGTVIDVSITLSPVRGKAGEVIGVSGVARDITERKRAEERFQVAVESAPNAMVMVNHEGRIVLANSQTEKLFGYRRNELIGQTVEILVPARFRARHPEFRKSFSGERVARPMGAGRDLRGLRKDGTEFPVEIGLNPIETEHGAWVLSAIVDITERKQAEEALREADRRKDEFLATLGHELRNPLASIQYGVQLLRTPDRPEADLRWAHDVIDRQMRQLTRLVDDLLDVSRITQGKIELRREDLPISAIVSSAVEACRSLLEASGHELTITVPEDGLFVRGDPARLAQVLANLLNNAAKYTPRGGRIFVGAERQDGEVVLSVRDNGVGIPPEMLSRVFEMFVQLDRSLERTAGGLGIGLNLARSLVEMHHGTVEAHSDGPGKGSEFIIRLPLVPPPAAVRPPGHDRAEQILSRTKYRILVADDNDDAAQMLRVLLQSMGQEVHTAADGLQAVELAATWRPDVALLDIGMPKLNGYDAARRIREQGGGKDIVLIALTGWGQEEDRLRAAEAGFNYHLTKPLDPDELAKLLTRDA